MGDSALARAAPPSPLTARRSARPGLFAWLASGRLRSSARLLLASVLALAFAAARPAASTSGSLTRAQSRDGRVASPLRSARQRTAPRWHRRSSSRPLNGSGDGGAHREGPDWTDRSAPRLPLLNVVAVRKKHVLAARKDAVAIPAHHFAPLGLGGKTPGPALVHGVAQSSSRATITSLSQIRRRATSALIKPAPSSSPTSAASGSLPAHRAHGPPPGLAQKKSRVEPLNETRASARRWSKGVSPSEPIFVARASSTFGPGHRTARATGPRWCARHR